jgi:ribose/xylose/arabinose/galactoside ABC-type transport system permease subunit
VSVQAQPAPRLPRLAALTSRLPDEFGVLVALGVIVAVIAIPHPNFLQPFNLFQIIGSSAFYGMIALGMVFLLALGEIDLSVGWNFNFSAVITAEAMTHGIDPWFSATLGVLFGAALGLGNGILVVALHLPVIIITLGTYSMFQGLSLVVNKSQPVVPPETITSTSFFDFTSATFFDNVIPVVAIVFAGLAVLLHLVLHRTRFGYRVQAIGSNPEAAKLTGLPIAWTKVQALVLVGAICGLSGALFVGFRGAIDPETGGTFILTVVAAAIIGGTPLSGGSGTVIGALVGTLIIACISSGIIFFGIDATWSTFVTGAVIVVAVGIDRVVRAQRRRRVGGGGV